MEWLPGNLSPSQTAWEERGRSISRPSETAELGDSGVVWWRARGWRADVIASGGRGRESAESAMVGVVGR